MPVYAMPTWFMYRAFVFMVDLDICSNKPEARKPLCVCSQWDVVRLLFARCHVNTRESPHLCAQQTGQQTVVTSATLPFQRLTTSDSKHATFLPVKC